MQTVSRAGVEFDMCPTCRGVWLDRGELEKILEVATDGVHRQSAPPPPQHQPQQAYQPRYTDDHYRHSPKKWDDDHYHHKKRKGFDIFDIFD